MAAVQTNTHRPGSCADRQDSMVKGAQIVTDLSGQRIAADLPPVILTGMSRLRMTPLKWDLAMSSCPT